MVNIILVVINVLVFFWEISLGRQIEPVLFNVAFVPARFWYLPGALLPNMITMFVSMFLHGGWLHLGGNMLYLWIFGDNVEDRLGHGRFLFFYLGCGLVAALTQVALSPDSTVPTVGASGAIAGVLGAYLISFPRSRVMTFIPLFIFPWIVEIPAVAYLIIWFAMQLLSGLVSLGQTEAAMGGIAWWAHIGGFVAGLLTVGVVAPRRLTQVA